MISTTAIKYDLTTEEVKGYCGNCSGKGWDWDYDADYDMDGDLPEVACEHCAGTGRINSDEVTTCFTLTLQKPMFDR